MSVYKCCGLSYDTKLTLVGVQGVYIGGNNDLYIKLIAYDKSGREQIMAYIKEPTALEYGTLALVEKRASIRPISPQTIRSAVKLKIWAREH
jgi:hypothetical protein